MKFYSDLTKKFYDTEKDCAVAEKNFELEQKKAKELAEKKANDRKAAAEKVEAARKAATEANKAYREALNEFCKTYGSFHQSYTVGDIDDLFDWFLRF